MFFIFKTEVARGSDLDKRIQLSDPHLSSFILMPLPFFLGLFETDQIRISSEKIVCDSNYRLYEHFVCPG